MVHFIIKLCHVFKVLECIGPQLTLLDLSGCGSVSQLTEKGLGVVSEHCHNLEALFLSLLSTVNGTGLLPLLQDPSRAVKLKKMSISIREVSA